jgi:hypothetical protein
MADHTSNEYTASMSSYHLPNVTAGGMSPHLIANTLVTHPHIPEKTIWEIATGFLHTIEDWEAIHEQAIFALKAKILQLEELIHNSEAEEFTLPDGYVKNKGKISGFDIPLDNGIYLPTKWIKLHEGDYTKACGLTGMQGPSEVLYSMEINASPDLLLTKVPKPLPLWVQALIRGGTCWNMPICHIVWWQTISATTTSNTIN